MKTIPLIFFSNNRSSTDMKCPYCNSDVSTGSSFCAKCGNRIPDHMMETAAKSSSATASLIAALTIFLVVAAGGVIGYLYFFAEPKRERPETDTYNEPAAPTPAQQKDHDVPMPDAGSSQSSQPESRKEAPQPDTESATPQPQPIPEPSPQPAVTVNPVDVVKPVLIHRVNPEYPEIARKSRIQGVVILEATVTSEGTVGNLKVVRGLHPILDQAAMKAVQQWRYKPATLSGKPVNVHTTITVNFKLK